MKALGLGLLVACSSPPAFHCDRMAAPVVRARYCKVTSCPGEECFTRPEAWCGLRNEVYACAPTQEECEHLAPSCRLRSADEMPTL